MTIKDYRVWLRGMAAAGIGGAANSIAVMIVDPVNFNIWEGLPNLGTVAGLSAVVSVAMYLKQSPLPGVSQKLP